MFFIPGNLLQNEANEFFLGFGPTDNRFSPVAAPTISVTTSSQDTVRFTMDTLSDFTFSGTVSMDSPVNVVIPQDFIVTNDSSSQRRKGIHVKAEGNKKVAVFGLNEDAYLALPCNHLSVQQYEYYAVTYHASTDFRPFVLLVGCENSTTITTVPFTFTLNRLETKLMSNIKPGARIVTDKPIAFFTGHPSAKISSINPFSHLVEQLPPTVTWGTFFLAGVGVGLPNLYLSTTIYRVFAAHDETHVNVTCTDKPPSTSVISIGGTFCQTCNIDSALCVIETNNPVLVMVFQSIEGTYPNSGYMSFIPPTDQYNNDYSLPFGYFDETYVTISVLPKYFQNKKIYVDDSIASAYWTPVKCSNGTICGYATTVSASSFVKHLDSDARIGVIVFGHKGYGCPAGFHIGSNNQGK